MSKKNKQAKARALGSSSRGQQPLRGGRRTKVPPDPTITTLGPPPPININVERERYRDPADDEDEVPQSDRSQSGSDDVPPNTAPIELDDRHNTTVVGVNS